MIQIHYLAIGGKPWRTNRWVAYHLNDFGKVVSAGVGMTRASAHQRMHVSTDLLRFLDEHDEHGADV